jgi:hypothetical protein
MAKKPPRPRDREPSPRFVAHREGDASSDIGLFEIMKGAFPLSSEEMKNIMLLHRESDDQTAALLASSHLDQVLGVALFLRLSGQSIPRKGAQGPSKGNNQKWKILHQQGGAFASFFSKIGLWYATGACSGDMFNDLNVIRRVRNEFAHSWTPLSFRTERIAKKCKKLHLQPNELILREELYERTPFKEKWSYPRYRFIETCEIRTREIMMWGFYDSQLMHEQQEMIDAVIKSLKPKP